jgi:signal transduction histidine kinase/DNA-binding response OmpR family regulator
MSNERILLILSNPEVGQILERAVLTPVGYQVTFVSEWKSAENMLQGNPPDLIIASNMLEGKDCIDQVKKLIDRFPFMPIILLPERHSEKIAIDAFRQGFSDYLEPPLHTQEIQNVVDRALKRRRKIQEMIHLATTRGTKELQQRVNGLEAIQRIGHKVTSTLDLDSILTAVVDAAVELTGAEEGSLLLLDETTGELYVRASRNIQEDLVSTLRLPIHDPLVSQVLRTGKPLLLDEETPKKIKTSYLVYNIMYMPLIVHDRVIGVLEVDNRQSRKSFSEYQVTLVSAMADYAAIAIDNANLYSHSESERNKLESILTGIGEGVLVVDNDRRLILINQKAIDDFHIKEKNLIGKRLLDVIDHQELLELIRDTSQTSPSRAELILNDGRVLNVLQTPLPSIGLIITMQDITHLKELDRIKSDFVNIVSHDLRSPLTAILGYVELIDRIGPVNDQQREFIRRVQLSVHNITTLINDLLDLGRIEAGFDARNEVVPISEIIHYALDSLRSRAAEKSQKLIEDIPENLPQVLGNPIRLRQVASNLILNAIKYTPEGGSVTINARAEGNQIILQVIDNGIGIPPADQPYIFDKFYRASNLPTNVPGTGLGLAIVKSIVENHLGRIWVESTLGQGTTFTIVLPTIDREL